LVGKALKIHGRDKFVVATKFGFVFENGTMTVSGKEEVIRSQLQDSLERLGTSYIDLYYMHRMDPATPIEETMAVLKSLVEEGKIKYIGLSECTPDELRRAHGVHPITAIQMEWSLQSRDIESEVVPCARELGVGIVPYSPLGRGFLADINALDSLDAKDSRAAIERYTKENLEENKRRLAPFFDIAQAKGCSAAQLALAWVHSQGTDVFPIPGTKSHKRIEENSAACFLAPLSVEDMRAIEAAVGSLVGSRSTAMAKSYNFDARI
jgi:aryl-alcohol dehydrogenase-like predicted oxidoreductase